MKNLAALFIATLLWILPQSANAEDTLNTELGATVASRYMYRGLERFDGLSLQPYAVGEIETESDLTYKGLVWGHLPLESAQPNVGSMSELNATLVVQYLAVKRVMTTLGHTGYIFPNKNTEVEDFAEVFVGASIDFMFTPSATVFYDYVESEAFYYQLTLHHQFIWPPFGDDFNVTAFGDFGWVTNDEGKYGDNGLAQITYGLSTNTNIAGIDFSPAIQITDAHMPGATHALWATLSLSF